MMICFNSELLPLWNLLELINGLIIVDNTETHIKAAESCQVIFQ